MDQVICFRRSPVLLTIHTTRAAPRTDAMIPGAYEWPKTTRPTMPAMNEPPRPASIVPMQPIGCRPGIGSRPSEPTIRPLMASPMMNPTQVVCPRHQRISSKKRSGVTEVPAEIAANVWQVPATVGQAVAVGDTIAILESMKMEIPVEAPVAGTITEVRVAPNDQVNEGDI